MTSRVVWFKLLDSSDGTPYRGTTDDAVSIPSDYVVDQFRDAVKAKLANTLSSLDAAVLLVYRDMASFEKRKDGVEDGSPLEEDLLIVDLGKSKREALIVAVPRISSLEESEHTHFPSLKRRKFSLAAISWPVRSEFRDIRLSGIPYVDKTRFFQKLFDRGHVFLSRPRRFGKTLLLNSLKELFLGNRELFEGLYIDATWDWTLKKYPVIKLDFSTCRCSRFFEDLCAQMIEEGKQYGLNFSKDYRSPASIFMYLASALRKINDEEGRHASFIILIDEYDKPVIDALGSPEIVSKNLGDLSFFFQLVKAASPMFSLVTGSSRLARSAIFTEDNVREDISFNPEFNSLCGFTEQDIIENLQLGTISLQDLKIWYNGYSFGGDEGIYNPFAIANAIAHQSLDCYWVKSGNTKLLEEFCGSVVMKDFIFNNLVSLNSQESLFSLSQSEDLSTLGRTSGSLQRLFLQSGYLTLSLDSKNSANCTLRIPNKEIRDYALPRLMIAGLSKMSVSECHVHFYSFKEAVQSRSLERIYDSIADLFQVFGFPDRGKIDKTEDYYQRILQAFFLASCPSVSIEHRTSLGKSDLFAEFSLWKILFELKVLSGTESVAEGHPKLNEAVEDAFVQAKTRYEPGLLPDAICILVFNTSTRTLFPRCSIGVPFYELISH